MECVLLDDFVSFGEYFFGIWGFGRYGYDFFWWWGFYGERGIFSFHILLFYTELEYIAIIDEFEPICMGRGSEGGYGDGKSFIHYFF